MRFAAAASGSTTSVRPLRPVTSAISPASAGSSAPSTSTVVARLGADHRQSPSDAATDPCGTRSLDPNDIVFRRDARNSPFASAEGNLGILLVGLGAVSTTTIAGIMAIRRGLAKPIGSLTADGHGPARQAHRQPFAAHQRLRAARRARPDSCSAAGTSSRTTATRRRRRPACSSRRCSTRSRTSSRRSSRCPPCSTASTSSGSTARTSRRARTRRTWPSSSSRTSGSSRRPTSWTAS